MKRLALLAAATLAASASAVTASGGIDEKVDRFTGAVTVTYGPPVKLGTMQPHLILVRQPGEKTFSGLIYLVMGSSDWHYLDCHSLYWLVDGKPMSAPYSFDSEMSGRTLLESFSVPVSEAQLQAIAHASSVEFKVCNDEYKFSSHDIDGFEAALQARGKYRD